jgi:hypothetical protein
MTSAAHDFDIGGTVTESAAIAIKTNSRPRLLCAALMEIADDEPAPDADQPDHLDNQRRHDAGCATVVGQRGGARYVPSAATKSSSPSGATVQSRKAAGPHAKR